MNARNGRLGDTNYRKKSGGGLKEGENGLDSVQVARSCHERSLWVCWPMYGPGRSHLLAAANPCEPRSGPIILPGVEVSVSARVLCGEITLPSTMFSEGIVTAGIELQGVSFIDASSE